MATFLDKTCYRDDPAAFLRLYLLILSEFTGQLTAVAGVMGIRLPKKARTLAVWANGLAKHDSTIWYCTTLEWCFRTNTTRAQRNSAGRSKASQ